MRGGSRVHGAKTSFISVNCFFETTLKQSINTSHKFACVCVCGNKGQFILRERCELMLGLLSAGLSFADDVPHSHI